MGPVQTDLFGIDDNGQLAVCWVVNAGPWGGPAPIGGPGFAPAGAPVAASQQFGIANQTDVFVVDNTGRLNVFWVDSQGAWNGPGAIGPDNFAPAGAHVAACQQFGIANQTDVFVVDNDGQLNVFWVDGAGAWAGPERIGPTGFAPSGAHVAACQQFGIANQTDVFVVDTTGQLNVFWVDGAGAWAGPERIGPAGIAPAGARLAVSQQFGIANQTDVFVVDNTGRLNVFWVDGAGAWAGPEAIGPAGLAPAGAALAACQQFGIANQTDVFVVDTTGRLNVFWVVGAGAWGGPGAIGPAGVAAAGAPVAASQQFGIANQTDVFVVDRAGQLNVFWVDGAGAWGGPEAIGPAGVAPATANLAASAQFGIVEELSFTMQHQQEANWCWAATATSVALYYEPSSGWTQCKVANGELGRTDCCGTGASGACNVYGYLDTALTVVGHFDHYDATTATTGQIETEILAGRPLGMRVAWSGGGAHFLAIDGQYTDGGTDHVLVADPIYGQSDVVYATLETAYQGIGTWTHTYYTKD